MNILQDESITLVKPCLSMRDEYYQYCQAFRTAHEPGYDMDELAFREFSKYISTLQDWELGNNLPTGWVPSSTYWLVRDGCFILGNSSLRYFLTPDLEELGGHIGYRIHPLERKKGYGTLILKLTLEKARERGMTDVLVTCDTANIGSAKVIMNNGGVLAYQGYSEKFKRAVSRYWIRL